MPRVMFRTVPMSMPLAMSVLVAVAVTVTFTMTPLAVVYRDGRCEEHKDRCCQSREMETHCALGTGVACYGHASLTSQRNWALGRQLEPK